MEDPVIKILQEYKCIKCGFFYCSGSCDNILEETKMHDPIHDTLYDIFKKLQEINMRLMKIERILDERDKDYFHDPKLNGDSPEYKSRCF